MLRNRPEFAASNQRAGVRPQRMRSNRFAWTLATEDVVDCKTFDELLPSFVDRTLSPCEHADFEDHRATCKPCRQVCDEYLATIELARAAYAADAPLDGQTGIDAGGHATDAVEETSHRICEKLSRYGVIRGDDTLYFG